MATLNEIQYPLESVPSSPSHQPLNPSRQKNTGYFRLRSTAHFTVLIGVWELLFSAKSRVPTRGVQWYVTAVPENLDLINFFFVLMSAAVRIKSVKPFNSAAG